MKTTMKYFITILFSILIAYNVSAQAPPQAFNYSGVARDASNNPLATRTIGIQLSILKNNPTTGTVVYKENHFTNTDALGLFNLTVGAGSVQSGVFANIDWSNDNYFLKVGLDANGGSNFVTMGTTQLLSVPYALYAKSAGNTSNRIDNDTSATNELQILSVRKDTIFLSNGGGYAKVPASSFDHDTSATNELQTLSIRNDTIFLTNGGFVKLPVGSVVGNKPTVTNSVTEITSYSARLTGNVTNDGGEIILTKGFCLGTSPNPTIPNIRLDQELGVYSYVQSNLNQSTTYYLRAFATNSNGTSYGNQVSFTTLANCFQQEDKLIGKYHGNLRYTSGGGIDSVYWDYQYDTIRFQNLISFDCLIDYMSGKFGYFEFNNITLPNGGTTFTTPNSNLTGAEAYLCLDQWCGIYDSYIDNVILNIKVSNITSNTFSTTTTIVSGVFKTTNSYYISKGYNNKNCAGAKFSGTYTK